MTGRGDDETRDPRTPRDESRRGAEGSTPGGALDLASAGKGWPNPPRTEVEAELRRAMAEASEREADEVALRRVWSRLSQIPDLVSAHPEESFSVRRVRWPFVAGASLAGAAAAAVAFMLLGGSVGLGRRPAPAAATPVAVVAPTPTRQDLGRSTLVAPATVRTASGETLQLALRGGAEVTVTSDSTLVLDEDERPTVSTGEVRFHVLPQPTGRTFVVRASGYRIVVVGTRFRVRVNGSNAAVGVDEGIVEVWNDASRLARVGAGESWVSPPAEATGVAPRDGDPAEASASAKVNPSAKADARTTAEARTAARPASPVQEARQGQQGKSISPSGVTRPGASAGEARPRGARGLRASLSPGVVSSALTSSPSGTAPANAVAGPAANPAANPSDRTLPFSAPADKPTAAVGAATNVAPASPSPPAPSPSPGAPAMAVTPPTDAALATQARIARISGESRKALGLYRALVARGGTAGENAEYEVARVLRDGLHQPHEAIAAWRAYRAQHPRGLLRVEADISVIETLVAADEKPAALAEAQEFVRRFPEGERRCEIGALAGDLLRERGDFRSALVEYDGALESGRCRRDMTDAISFHRAVSLLHDEREDGVAALQAYLNSFASGRFRAAASRLVEEQTKALAARRL